MKKEKYQALVAVLKSAIKTSHIQRLSEDPADCSMTFMLQNRMYEIQWDDNELEFEMVKYTDRRTFERMGYVTPSVLSNFIY